jgi:hypothetical protein
MNKDRPLLCSSCGKEIEMELALKRALDEYFGQEPTRSPLCKDCVLAMTSGSASRVTDEVYE